MYSSVCASIYISRAEAMTVRDFLEIIHNSDNLLIVRDAESEAGQETIYKGYKALLVHDPVADAVLDAQVKRFRASPEIRHKDWESRGLMPPMEPEKTPDFRFSDLRMTLYYKIII